MADLESLNYPSISDMSTDEALEALRQIRLSRRVPMQQTKTTRKVVKKEVKVDPSTMTADQIAELLKTLGG
uniref:Uncharacterized protein n=1 Tax=viral metagenome TaxID=1070528 RepID=A0A6M3IH14_9ZZZZ